MCGVAHVLALVFVECGCGNGNGKDGNTWVMDGGLNGS